MFHILKGYDFGKKYKAVEDHVKEKKKDSGTLAWTTPPKV